MIHYHGTPITPRSKLVELAGRSFCVPFSDPRDVEVCHQIGQSVMLDNGAYSFWTRGRAVDWTQFTKWVRPWLDYRTTWAVMPDVIDGSLHDNLELYCWLAKYHRDVWRRSAPVWHMHEPIRHLLYLCGEHERVCIGSSGAYADPTTERWRDRMDEAMEYLCPTGAPPTQLHMLRAMAQVTTGRWPCASADSTNVARNHHRASAVKLAQRIDAAQAPGRWTSPAAQLSLLDLDRPQPEEASRQGGRHDQ